MVKGLIALIRTVRKPELRGLAFLVLTLFACGTVFYSVVEDWSVLDSLYFSVMTLLTAGYGDLVPTTAGSKVFTIFYVIVGAGILVGFITLVAREAMGLPRPDQGHSGSES
jgi:voltage-gated potassium channel